MTLGATSERFRLLFAVLAWLIPREQAEIDEVARQFGIEPADVVALVETAACCGVPPYSADALLDLYIDEDRIEASLGSILKRPRRFTAPEGFALAAAARAILSVSGADPEGALSRATAKLEDALGEHTKVAVVLDGPDALDDIRAALASRRQVEIEYYSASRDQVSKRRIEPFHLFAVDGHWYVDAHCHVAGAVRHFRVDRVRSVVSTGDEFAVVEPLVEGELEGKVAPAGIQDGAHTTGAAGGQGGSPIAAFFEDAPDVVIEIPGDRRRVVEGLPVRSTSEIPGGNLRVVLPLGGVPWLERLMLMLGPGARVLAPPELVDLPARAASRIRRLYPQD